MRLSIHGLDGLLEAPEQPFRPHKSTGQVDRAAQFIDIFQHLVKMLQVVHDDIAVLLQDRDRDEEVELRTQVIRPQPLPQSQHVAPFELALVPDEQHAEEEEEIGRVGRLEVEVEGRVEELDELVQRGQLGAHTGLVAHEVTTHAPHEADKGPEGDRVVLHNGVNGREEVRHALDVAQILRVRIGGVGAGGCAGVVVLEVGEEHVLELFEVDIGAVAAGDVEGRGRVRMWDIFASEEGDVTICAVDVFLYGADSQVSRSSEFVLHDAQSKGKTLVIRICLAYQCGLFALSTIPLLLHWHRLLPFSPTKLPLTE